MDKTREVKTIDPKNPETWPQGETNCQLLLVDGQWIHKKIRKSFDSGLLVYCHSCPNAIGDNWENPGDIIKAIFLCDNNGWIRVEDGLPPIFEESCSELMIVTWLYKDIVRTGGRHYCQTGFGFPATHWQPMPSIPTYEK